MMQLADIIRSRRSIRAFLPDPLDEAELRDLLDVARFAPSGGNVQPWRVIMVSGGARDAVIAAAQARLMHSLESEEGDRPIYPENLWEPHRSWRYQVGEAMYAKLGIAREEKMQRLQWLANNYQFFGAPHAAFFVIDRRMGHGQWAHLGMFMQSLALAAEANGIGTCMQESWARLRVTLAAHFGLPDTQMVYCAMALGRADPAAAVNQLRSERAEIDEFTQFLS